jgi:hypothetical protein
MPRMTATGTARVLGALITAWLVSEAASSFASSQLHQVMLFGLLACPAIAVAFSLPRTSFSAYLGIGLALAAFVAVIRGIAGPPDPRQELTGGEEFIVGFLFSAFFSLFGLTLGGLAFSLVRTSLGVLIQRMPNKRHINELRKSLALVLPFAAVVVWIAGGFLLIWVPVVAILAALFLWPPGYEDSFNSISPCSEERTGDSEISDLRRQEATGRERTRRAERT